MAVAMRGTGTAAALPEIPVVDLGAGSLADLVTRHPDRLRLILDTARRTYTGPALWLGDRLTRAWAGALPPPFRDDLAEVASAVGEPGAFLLNFSYEWGCTTAGTPDADGRPRLLRTLDWQLSGLGRTVVAVRRTAPAGPWVNLTWPGFVGAVQGLAPGRFAAAINQAPGPRTPFGFPGDWLASKVAAWRADGLPPVLALRAAFDTARTFAEARRLLAETPVCAPVLFSVVGAAPGEGALIERAPGRTVVHDGLPAATNHWLTPGLPGRSWSLQTRERLAALRAHLAARRPGAEPFAWVVPPIRNATTRLAMEACPAAGTLVAQGFEEEGPVTAPLALAS